jgi:hypothetical protein
VIVISILIRQLREGKTYQDFREAWLPDQGFDFPTRVVSAQNVQNEREGHHDRLQRAERGRR